MSQLRSMNSTASQSNNSGCVGGFPLLPKLKTVGTSGFPKWRSQMWLMATRAVSGLSFAAIHGRVRAGGRNSSSGISGPIGV